MSNSSNNILSIEYSEDRYTPDFYDKQYFETGLMSGKSCYTYFRWMPEQTFRLAMSIIEYTDLKRDMTVLDFGCAKGFLVKALRYLFRNAHGSDWSNYCLENIDEVVKNHVRLSTIQSPIPFDTCFDLCIAKDVLEHIPYYDLPRILQCIRKKTDRFLMIVPLGDKFKYLIEAYEKDKSHIIRENFQWWIKQLENSGFTIIKSDYYVPGIKDAWYKIHPKGNAVILAE